MQQKPFVETIKLRGPIIFEIHCLRTYTFSFRIKKENVNLIISLLIIVQTPTQCYIIRKCEIAGFQFSNKRIRLNKSIGQGCVLSLTALTTLLKLGVFRHDVFSFDSQFEICVCVTISLFFNLGISCQWKDPYQFSRRTAVNRWVFFNEA